MSVSVGDMSHIAALLTRRHPQLELYVYGVQRTNKLRTGGILMARGRDATDIAIVTSFGPCTLAGFKVITHRSLHLLQCSHANQTHRLMRDAKLLGSPLSVIGILASRLASMMWRSRSLSRPEACARAPPQLLLDDHFHL